MRGWSTTSRRLRTATGCLAVAIACVALAGCSSGSDDGTSDSSGGSPASGAGASEQTLRISAGYLPSSMDPGFDNSLFSIGVYSYIFDGLTRTDEQGEVQPLLAKSWKTETPTRWTFELRDDVKFQNGDPMTAEDAAFSIQRLTDPDVAAAWLGTFPTIKSVKASGPHTVTIQTTEPTADLAQKLAVAFVVPAAVVREKGEAFANEPVGTGPYAVDDWAVNDHLSLRAWDGYWGEKPKIAEVEIANVPEEDTRIADLKAGTAQITYPVGPDHVEGVDAEDGLAVETVPIAQNFVVSIKGVGSGPLADERVRQALNYAVDAQGLFEGLMHSQGRVLQGQLGGPGVFGYDEALEAYPHDPDRARQLLAEAGYADGFQTTMDIAPGRYPQDLQTAEAVIAQLQEVGVRVKLRTVTSNALLNSWLKGTISPLYVWGWNNPPTMATAQPYIYFQSSQPQKILDSKEFDAAYAEQSRELDVDARRAQLEDLGGLVRDLAPAIFLWQVPFSFGVSDQVAGFEANVQGSMNITAMELRSG